MFPEQGQIVRESTVNACLKNFNLSPFKRFRGL